MELLTTRRDFRDALDRARAGSRRVGLVPTMGYLHAGHRSLLAASVTANDCTALTIFVNPLQFAPGEDLDSYPRDLDGDLTQASEAGADVVFVPTTEEMYPSPVRTTVRVDVARGRMEAAARPTHFDGVATVVAKLFALAGPCRAYFGEKDYQQLAVVSQLTTDLDLPVEVVGCPIVRDADGLALSSRNAYLTPQERAVAPTLHAALVAGREAVLAGERSPARVRELMAGLVRAEPAFTLDYAEVVDATTLEEIADDGVLAGDLRLLVAARLGVPRLLDNVGVHVP